MFVKVIFITCSVFVFAETAFLDTLGKCSISDDDCLKKVYGNVIRGIGSTGIPDYGIPPIDPIELKDLTLSIADLVTITLVDGTATGITKCRYNKFKMDIKKERGKTELACDLTIGGKYKLYSSSPVIKTFLNGSEIRGDGNGKVVLDKVLLKMDFPFYAQKRDGEIYLKCDYKNAKYDFDVLGKLAFEADNLYLGDKEASKEIISILNANWKFVVATVGKNVVDIALGLYMKYSSQFFDAAPARHFITDDLTPYARA